MTLALIIVAAALLLRGSGTPAPTAPYDGSLYPATGKHAAYLRGLETTPAKDSGAGDFGQQILGGILTGLDGGKAWLEEQARKANIANDGISVG
jgi:hypothetical protein